MVFSSYLFLFYLFPLALAAYYAAPVRMRHLVALALQLRLLRLGQSALPVPAARLDAARLHVGAAHREIRGRARRRRNTSSILTSRVPGAPGSSSRSRSSRTCRSSGSSSTSTSASTTTTRWSQWIGLPELRPRRRAAGHAAARHQLLHVPVDELRDRRVPRPGAGRSGTSSTSPCFVSMFPQLVAGPIIRFSEIADQTPLADAHDRRSSRAASRSSRSGWRRRSCSPIRAARSRISRSTPGRLTAVDAWYGVTAYAFQIYFDFSGYSDMAIGLGLMLGFVFAKNFDSPYKSQSITEFWRRWHISLSTWLRDYLYVPLGGNRKGPARTYVNLLVVMLLGGLWHGAVLELRGLGRRSTARCWRSSGCAARPPSYGRLPPPARVALTFGLVLVAWVFFRARRSARGDALPRPHERRRRRATGVDAARPASSISRTTWGHSCSPASSPGPARRRGTGRGR